jgi:hypothetical protein
MGIPQNDIKDKKYGLLTAVKWSHTEKHTTKKGRVVYHNFWEFVCDCGTRKTLRKHRVISGKSAIMSCGCLVNKHKWTGYKEISGTYWGCIKKAAKIREIDFDISISYAWSLYEAQGGKCALSGVDIPFKSGQCKGWDNRSQASLDRIDSSNGYVDGNVQWVHKDLNVMKWDYTAKEFIAWCIKVAEYNKEVG